jgi:hypothetical protein
MGLVGNISGSSVHESVIGVTGSVVFAGADTSYASDFPHVGNDVAFYVSGSIGTQESSTERGTAVFGGDLVISGTLDLNDDYGLSVMKAEYSHDLAAGASDTQNVRAASVTVTVNGNISADESVGNITISSNKISSEDTIVASTSVSGISCDATAVTDGSFNLSFFNDSGAQVNNDSTFVVNWIAL